MSNEEKWLMTHTMYHNQAEKAVGKAEKKGGQAHLESAWNETLLS